MTARALKAIVASLVVVVALLCVAHVGAQQQLSASWTVFLNNSAIVESVAVGDDLLAVIAFEGLQTRVVRVYDARTGAERWSHNGCTQGSVSGGTASFVVPFAKASQVVVFCSGNASGIAVFAAATGEFVASVAVPGLSWNKKPLSNDTHLIAADGTRFDIHAFAKDGSDYVHTVVAHKAASFWGSFQSMRGLDIALVPGTADLLVSVKDNGYGRIGEVVWNVTDGDVHFGFVVSPVNRQLAVHVTANITCINVDTGAPVWSSEQFGWPDFPPQFTPSGDELVLLTRGGIYKGATSADFYFAANGSAQGQGTIELSWSSPLTFARPFWIVGNYSEIDVYAGNDFGSLKYAIPSPVQWTQSYSMYCLAAPLDYSRSGMIVGFFDAYEDDDRVAASILLGFKVPQ